MIRKISDYFYQFLIRTQKYTGTDNVYLVRGGFWLTLGQLVATASSFLLALSFANLLDPEIYGQYKYILSIFGMLGVFSLLGMRKAIAQAVARGLEGSFYNGFKTKLKWSTIGSLIAVIVAIYYFLQGNKELPIPLLISAVFFPLMMSSQIYAGFLGGRKLFDVQTKFNTVRYVIFTVVMVLTLLLTKNLVWLIAAYLISNTFLHYSFYLITKIKFKPNKQEDSQSINYGKHLSLMGVISQGATYLDKILLFNLAIYSFATLLPEEIQSVLSHISTLALPKLAPKSREEIRKTIMKKFWKLALLTLIVAILYVVLAPFIYRIFFSQYSASIPYSQIFVLSFVSIPVTLLGTVFEAKIMKKELYLIKIAPFIRIGLFALLIPFYGIWGVIWGIVGAEVFKSAIVLFLFRKF